MCNPYSLPPWIHNVQTYFFGYRNILRIAAAVIWAVVNELLIQPMEYTCFNLTLKKLQDDPRVTVRLGTPVSGYGQDSRNRQARQRIPHRVYKDASGREKIQVRL